MLNNGTNVGRPWTPAEDKLLREAVAIYGDDTEKWKTIALSVPGRTNKACRKRWLHSLCPTVKKTAWTQDEDARLLALFASYPNKWSQIAREIPGRTDDACSKRYRESLDPNLKKDEWTDEEDKKLYECHVLHGGKWGAIGLALRRSGLGCRNRWRLLERKKNSAPRHTETFSQLEPSPASSDSWNPFGDNPSSNSYWHSALGHWNPSADTAIYPDTSQAGNHGHHASEFGPDRFSTSDIVIPIDNIDPSLSTNQSTAAIFNFSSSSLSTALIESEVLTRRASGSIDNTPNTEHGFDDAGSEMWDFSMNMDNDDPVNVLAESTQPFGSDTTFSVPSSSSCAEEPISQQSEEPEESDAREIEVNSPPNLVQRNEVEPVLHEEPTAVTEARSAVPLPDASKERPTKKQRTAIRYDVQVNSINGRETRPPPPKLSSTLPVASDPTILGYACGSRECWESGSARFSTSGELLIHYKAEHALEPCGSQDTPFRCGLRDCAKGWKSINGLQYHLQISKAHFKQVLTAAALRNNTHGVSSEPSIPPEAPLKKKKMHDCPHDNCPKTYKQLSGLRYHLQHGHPNTLPMQLDVVPPTIARQLGVQGVQLPVAVSVSSAPS